MRWKHASKLLFATTLVTAGCSDLTDDTSTTSIGRRSAIGCPA